MDRGAAVADDFAIFDEGSIPEAKLLCLSLLCFRYLCVFAPAHRPEVGGSCKFAHRLAKFCGVRGKAYGRKREEPFLLKILWIALLV